MKDWLNKTNITFSRLYGEKFTNSEIILAHVGCILFVGMCLFAEYINNL